MSYSSITLILLAFSLSFSGPSKELCTVVKGCELSQSIEGCSRINNIDSTRCIEARELDSRHVKINDSIGSQLYGFLGHKHRIVYTISDTVDVSPAKLSYLLNNLDLATKIVNYLRHTPYIFEYIQADHTFFNVAQGEGIKGQVHVVSGSTKEQALYYFGTGTVKVGLITFKGPALVTLKYSPASKDHNKSVYTIKVVVVLNSGLLSSILDTGIIRSQVLDKIQHVLDDVMKSAVIAKDKNIILQGPWNPIERQQIEMLLKLP